MTTKHSEENETDPLLQNIYQHRHQYRQLKWYKKCETRCIHICLYLLIIIMLVSMGTIIGAYLWKNQIKHHNILDNQDKTILIIRHCQKRRNSEMGLSDIGVIHASCLVPYFENFPFGRPKFGFAQLSKTRRSIRTLLAVSTLLEIPLIYTPKSINIRHIAKIIFNKLLEHNVIVIAWEHHSIPTLAMHLGCKNCTSWNLNPFTHEKDNNTLYDITWVLQYKKKYLSFYDYQDDYDVKMSIYNQNFFNDTCISCISDFKYKQIFP